MEISFADEALRAVCNTERELKKAYGKQRAKLMRRRLDDLDAVDNLAHMRQLPGRCHELKGNHAGQLSLDLDGPYRLIFRPNHDPLPTKLDGGLDWTRVTAITVLGVEDTHE